VPKAEVAATGNPRGPARRIELKVSAMKPSEFTQKYGSEPDEMYPRLRMIFENGIELSSVSIVAKDFSPLVTVVAPPHDLTEGVALAQIPGIARQQKANLIFRFTDRLGRPVRDERKELQLGKDYEVRFKGHR
jgi:hypothetical protein